VQAFPIGIDVEAFRRLAAASVRARRRRRCAPRRPNPLGARKLVIGVDRLDYSKGIVQRLEAFGAVPARPPGAARPGRPAPDRPAIPQSDVPEYADLDRQSDETRRPPQRRSSASSTGPRSASSRRPIRASALAGFYRRAQVGLVTPMRDGMNLVAKEYIAAQDPADPGVLVLSRFAGAAQQMGEALIVNPYDTQGVAEAIRTALAMPISERQRRFERLYATIAATDIRWWTRKYLAVLSGLATVDSEAVPPVSRKPSAAPKGRARPAELARKTGSAKVASGGAKKAANGSAARSGRDFDLGLRPQTLPNTPFGR
jgi:trehalose 6-phosphate synthase